MYLSANTGDLSRERLVARVLGDLAGELRPIVASAGTCCLAETRVCEIGGGRGYRIEIERVYFDWVYLG
jgi:hypothetical protein